MTQKSFRMGTNLRALSPTYGSTFQKLKGNWYQTALKFGKLKALTVCCVQRLRKLSRLLGIFLKHLVDVLAHSFHRGVELHNSFLSSPITPSSVFTFDHCTFGCEIAISEGPRWRFLAFFFKRMILEQLQARLNFSVNEQWKWKWPKIKCGGRLYAIWATREAINSFG